jgi:hypothetical protein
MKNLVTSLFLVCLLGVSQPLVGQSTEDDAVKATILRLFDGMRLADSTMVSSVFVENALLASVVEREGKQSITHTPAEVFIRNVTRPRADILDERTEEMEIRIDDNIAMAWVPYAFYVGKNFSHCGVNAIQLAKTDGEWKIIFVIDTRRKDNCIVN